MANNEDGYFSIKLTRFFMKVVGFWNFETWKEKLILNLCLTYTIAAVTFAIAVESVDLCYCWGDFDAITYNACATMPMVLVLVKVSVFMIRRDVVVHLITYAEKNFWKVYNNDFEKQIMRECERKGMLFVCTVTFFVSGTVFNYLFAPIIENIGKNSTDRVLPFKLWVDLPLTTTPYFEITFVIQSLSTIHSGICFFCFDNLLCILTIHIVGQLKILQHRLRSICDKYVQIKNKPTDWEQSTKDITVQTEIYYEFKSCIVQHRALIGYVDTLESVYTLILLYQMIVSSLLMCLSGFQLLLASWNVVRRLIFISHICGTLSQLLLITWTCNEITLESMNIADAAYVSGWYIMPQNKIGTPLRRGLLILMARVRRPLFLSAGKFCPMSLESFGAIVRTAVSYFTLLRQMSEEIKD